MLITNSTSVYLGIPLNKSFTTYQDKHFVLNNIKHAFECNRWKCGR